MAGASNCDIMLSYDPDDKKIVRKIKKKLKEEGYDCWMDKVNMPGARQEAITAVDACTVFLMCYSSEYFNNKDCKGGKCVKNIYINRKCSYFVMS